MDLLQLDRTTIYRKLNNGSLPAVRVGGQWRFSRQAIELWLQDQNRAGAAATPEAEPAASPPLDSHILPLHCVEPIQDVFGQTADIGALTTDLDGALLTHVSNSCAFCDLILSTEEGRARCRRDWQRLAAHKGAPPRLETCHAGLTYAGGRIEVGGASVAMFFGGQFVTDRQSPALSRRHVAAVAAACQVDEGALLGAAQEVRVVDSPRAERLLALIQKVADTFSTIGRERMELLARLKKVAEIAGGAEG